MMLTFHFAVTVFMTGVIWIGRAPDQQRVQFCRAALGVACAALVISSARVQQDQHAGLPRAGVRLHAGACRIRGHASPGGHNIEVWQGQGGPDVIQRRRAHQHWNWAARRDRPQLLRRDGPPARGCKCGWCACRRGMRCRRADRRVG